MEQKNQSCYVFILPALLNGETRAEGKYRILRNEYSCG